MKNTIVFVTGFFGAPVMQTALKIADEENLDIISLDDEIEKNDGRSVRRICMVMGEHEYRNKEYEVLKKLNESAGSRKMAICCGDGVLHDEMSRDIILGHRLVIVGKDMSIDELWENAKASEGSYHAFMHFGTPEEKRNAFEKLWQRQCALFKPYI